MEVFIDIRGKLFFGLAGILLAVILFNGISMASASLNTNLGWHSADQISGGTIQGTLGADAVVVGAGGGSSAVKTTYLTGKLLNDAPGPLVLDDWTIIGSTVVPSGLEVYGKVVLNSSDSGYAVSANSVDVIGDMEVSGTIWNHTLKYRLWDADFFDQWSVCSHSYNNPKKLIHSSQGLCWFTEISGPFDGSGKGVKVYIDSNDGYWYLGAYNPAGNDVCGKAACAGNV
jgi:hypothetical protein